MRRPGGVWPFVTRQWRALAGSGGSTVVLTAAELAKPWPLALVFDDLLSGHDGPFTLDERDVRLLALLAVLVVAIAAADAVAQYCADLWLQSAGERITHELRVAVYAHLQRLSLGFHQRSQKGDLVNRLTGDVTAVGTLFSDSLGTIAQQGLLLIGMLVVVFVLDPVLGLVSVAMMPALAAVSWVYRRRVRTHARLQRAQEGQIASLAGEALSAMPVVKAFGSERYEEERVRSRSAERMAIGMQVARLQARFDGLVGVLSAIGTALVIVVGVLRVASGALSPGGLIVFASYARKAHSPLRSLAREATKVARAMARAERIAEILAADDLLHEPPGAYHGARARGEVRLEAVSFAYESERPALRDVSLEIPAGAHVAVIGPSGSGKSTLGALIARFHDPVTGRVVIDDHDARNCSLAWLREQVGVLLQDTVLFTGTVEENIAYASEAGHEQVVAAARAAAADDLIASLPAGYGTQLGPQGVGLSGGQRQRIGIARTLLRDPPVLVLDEPTTGLDRESEARLMDGLRELMVGRTTMLMTHSLELARGADRVVVMREGRVVADGPPAEVVPDEGSFRRLAGAPLPPRRTVDAAVDPGFPHRERLLDPAAVAASLQRSLGREATLAEVKVGRVVYAPGERLAVHYWCRVGEERHDVVVTRVGNADLAAVARKPRYEAMARRAAALSPAPAPLRYDPALEALVMWLPFDPRLPGLLEPAPRLARRLASAGVPVEGEMGEPRRIGYKPRARAVLRLDGHVLKAYGKHRQFEAARDGLLVAARDANVSTAAFEAAFPDLRLTVQSAVDGVTPGAAADVAGAAGALVGRLQRSSVEGLVAAGCDRELAAAVRKATVVRAVLPDLGPRLDALLARLGAAVPPAPPLVVAHGDFHIDQLLEKGGDLLAIDFDQICLAPPALDLATYAADVVRGRPGDADAIAAVLQPLFEGYGGRPAYFDWHLAAAILGRAAHPFQRQVPGWPERVEATVEAAEGALS
jgi:ATP-binding cassette subfamily B protein/subfamily B ATP-binding cassette protein MsbA